MPLDSIALTRDDPIVGTALLKGVLDIHGVSPLHDLASKQRLLIVGLGDCQSCSLKHFHVGDEKPYYARVLLLFTTTEDKVDSKYKNLPSRYRILCDPLGVTAKALNVSWTPRYYVCDSSGRLLQIQKYNEGAEGY